MGHRIITDCESFSLDSLSTPTLKPNYRSFLNITSLSNTDAYGFYLTALEEVLNHNIDITYSYEN